MDKILVAIDGSPTSILALKEARDLAEKYGSNVQIMTVVTHANVYAYAYPPSINKSFEEESVKNAKTMLSEAEELFEGYPGKVETLSVHGDAADEILKQVEQDMPDLLVMGSRGMGTFKRLMLGSVVSKVLNNICCNMFVVRQCKP